MSARRAAVLGHPIEHSLSPVLHEAAYRALGLDWTYGRGDVTEDTLAAFLDGCGPEWVGLSLTMPLKTAVLPLLDRVTPLATSVAAVNTVTLSDGERWGDNTDVPGAVRALERARGEVAHATGAMSAQSSAPGSAAILGGGATARSLLAASARLGAPEVAVYVRRPEAGEAMRPLADELGVLLVVEPWERAAEALLADLVLSSVPAGIADGLAGAVPWSPGTLLDVVYAPWPTPLATEWAQRGGMVASGLDLLVEQAALQVEIWTGRPAPVEAMRAAVGP